MIGLTVIWALMFAAARPIRQAYINGSHPVAAEGNDPVLFDSLMASGGGVWTQPAPGRAADVWGTPVLLDVSRHFGSHCPSSPAPDDRTAPADTAGTPPQASRPPARVRKEGALGLGGPRTGPGIHPLNGGWPATSGPAAPGARPSDRHHSGQTDAGSPRTVLDSRQGALCCRQERFDVGLGP